MVSPCGTLPSVRSRGDCLNGSAYASLGPAAATTSQPSSSGNGSTFRGTADHSSAITSGNGSSSRSPRDVAVKHMPNPPWLQCAGRDQFINWRRCWLFVYQQRNHRCSCTSLLLLMGFHGLPCERLLLVLASSAEMRRSLIGSGASVDGGKWGSTVVAPALQEWFAGAENPVSRTWLQVALPPLLAAAQARAGMPSALSARAASRPLTCCNLASS